MKDYETTLILDSQSISSVEENAEKVKKLITDGGGKVADVKDLENRKLAYPIKKKEYGHYVTVQFQADAQLVEELDRRFKLDGSILRHLIIRLGEREE